MSNTFVKVVGDVTSYSQVNLATSDVIGILPPANGGVPSLAPDLVYVSKLTGNDANSGSYSTPVKTFTQALILTAPAVGSQVIICLDGETYDEVIVIPNNVYIYASSAVIQSIATIGDCITINGFCDISFALIQSTTGRAINITAGFPIIQFQNGFGTGNIENNSPNTITITCQGFGNTINQVNVAGTIVLISDIAVSTLGNVVSPWSNSLVPQGSTSLRPSSVSISPTVFSFFNLINATSYIWYSSTAQNSQAFQTAINNYGTYTFYCAKGNYNVTVSCAEGTDRGILQVLINGVLSSTIDLYNLSVNNNLSTQFSVSLNEGSNTIQLLCNSKNVASSAFTITLSDNIILNKI